MEKTALIEINLSKGEFTELFLECFAKNIKNILKSLDSGYSIPAKIKGNKEQINSFSNAIKAEKDYIDAYKNYGHEAPMTYKTKLQLNKAIEQFERTTNIIWPIK